MAIRKNVNTLSKAEKQDFIRAVLGLKENNSVGNKYNQYVQWHTEAALLRTPSGAARTAAHAGPAFLAWHREFIRRFELDLQTIVPGIGLPYWDWAADAALADPKTSPMWASDFMGGDGDASDGSYVVKTGAFAYGKWVIIDENGNPTKYGDGKYTGALKRRLGEAISTLPKQKDVDAALNLVPYDEPPWDKTASSGHRNRLEGYISAPQLHNRVHRWVGGSMRPLTSPNDPVFFLHHSNVDRLWAQWQTQNPSQGYVPSSGGPIGHNLDDPMFPWAATPADVLDHQAIGYIYDTELY